MAPPDERARGEWLRAFGWVFSILPSLVLLPLALVGFATVEPEALVVPALALLVCSPVALLAVAMLLRGARLSGERSTKKRAVAWAAVVLASIVVGFARLIAR